MPDISNRYAEMQPSGSCYDLREMSRTLFQKVWDLHAVRALPNGQTQLYVGLHLVHEVTSPQAFDELRARGWRVRAPERTFATVDHIVPDASRRRGRSPT